MPDFDKRAAAARRDSSIFFCALAAGTRHAIFAYAHHEDRRARPLEYHKVFIERRQTFYHGDAAHRRASMPIRKMIGAA